MSARPPNQPRASSAQGLVPLTAWCLVATAALALVIVASRSGFALTFIVIAGVFASAPGLVGSLAYLRLLRLLAGGMTAVTGAVLIMQVDFLQAQPKNEDAGFVAVMLGVALMLAAAGTWWSDWRVQSQADAEQQRREQLAAERHAELVRLLNGREPQPPKVRLRDLALVAIATRLLRR